MAACFFEIRSTLLSFVNIIVYTSHHVNHFHSNALHVVVSLGRSAESSRRGHVLQTNGHVLENKGETSLVGITFRFEEADETEV